VATHNQERILYPTHDCFTDALEFLELAAARANRGQPVDMESFRLVHAVCTAPDGRLYAHAWIEERGELVWQAALYQGERVFFTADKARHYKVMNIHELVVYTPHEVAEENDRTGTLGPWKQSVIDCCNDMADKQAWVNDAAPVMEVWRLG
jgi:hypothetical protein